MAATYLDLETLNQMTSHLILTSADWVIVH